MTISMTPLVTGPALPPSFLVSQGDLSVIGIFSPVTATWYLWARARQQECRFGATLALSPSEPGRAEGVPRIEGFPFMKFCAARGTSGLNNVSNRDAMKAKDNIVTALLMTAITANALWNEASAERKVEIKRRDRETLITHLTNVSPEWVRFGEALPEEQTWIDDLDGEVGGTLFRLCGEHQIVLGVDRDLWCASLQPVKSGYAKVVAARDENRREFESVAQTSRLTAAEMQVLRVWGLQLVRRERQRRSHGEQRRST
jgi:hypothetical protein